MKSLTSIDEILHNQSEIRTTAQAFFDENTSFPLNIEGLHGSLFSLFTAEVCRSNHVKALQAAQYSASSKSSPSYKVFSSDLIIVVPTEADARDIAGDFAAIYEEAEVHIFPDRFHRNQSADHSRRHPAHRSPKAAGSDSLPSPA